MLAGVAEAEGRSVISNLVMEGYITWGCCCRPLHVGITVPDFGIWFRAWGVGYRVQRLRPTVWSSELRELLLLA